MPAAHCLPSLSFHPLAFSQCTLGQQCDYANNDEGIFIDPWKLSRSDRRSQYEAPQPVDAILRHDCPDEDIRLQSRPRPPDAFVLRLATLAGLWSQNNHVILNVPSDSENKTIHTSGLLLQSGQEIYAKAHDIVDGVTSLGEIKGKPTSGPGPASWIRIICGGGCAAIYWCNDGPASYSSLKSLLVPWGEAGLVLWNVHKFISQRLPNSSNRR
ncbi:hypothetical protein QBC45DRAFT_490615 [Copromyces sp. CBS 386.78]|nr:hypothetical protein QBC45DRAFT_490615 [Copromyces sp. CBS 386.78]